MHMLFKRPSSFLISTFLTHKKPYKLKVFKPNYIFSQGCKYLCRNHKINFISFKRMNVFIIKNKRNTQASFFLVLLF